MSSTSVEELFEENQKLVYFVLNKYYDWLAQDEDIIQEGNLGLWKAAYSWNPSKSKFSTYATTCILNQIKMELRKRSRMHNFDEISLSTPVSDVDSELTLEDVIPDKKDYFEEVESVLDFQCKLNNLTDKEKDVLSLLVQGYSQQDIANVMNCTRANISRIKRNFFKKLKK